MTTNNLEMERIGMMRKVVTVGATVPLVAAMNVALAQSQGFDVTANVENACEILSVNDLNFGDYEPIGANETVALRRQAVLQIRCVAGSEPSLELNDGSNSQDGTVATRRMAGTTDNSVLADYDIFLPDGTAPNSPCTSYQDLWGNGSNGGNPLQADVINDIAFREYNLCGEMPAGQDISAQAYTDTVTLTVTFDTGGS